MKGSAAPSPHAIGFRRPPTALRVPYPLIGAFLAMAIAASAIEAAPYLALLRTVLP